MKHKCGPRTIKVMNRHRVPPSRMMNWRVAIGKLPCLMLQKGVKVFIQRKGAVLLGGHIACPGQFELPCWPLGHS